MRRTAKYTQGVKVLRELGESFIGLDNEKVNGQLEEKGYYWDAEQSQWIKGNPPSTSIFETDEGLGTGTFRLRVMAHPSDLTNTLKALRTAFQQAGIQVEDVSKEYPNRRGRGVRVYITAKLSSHRRGRRLQRMLAEQQESEEDDE